jgi:hypothetical protein
MASSIRRKLALSSPTSGGRSVGIVRSRTQAMEFVFEALLDESRNIILAKDTLELHLQVF